eukprot:TRINITY_DN8669_c0_g1_i1.p1 TRINITY_DN8669_c0_g1~~TRINITY_DN8669_c0_g1_i1.p1  ORF type:complete len:606 (-),score=233.28 TRINITY_DN8669_c0_g1_i1:208-2025(-)
MAKRKNGKKNARGIKKADKIHGQKKGKKGEAAAYCTRAQALAKLQLPLADFRKLCILKGIYPRDPKKKPSGNDKTYYHHKDISFLMHEPLIKKFFELKTFMKKFKRLLGRDEKGLAKSLEGRKPEYTLSHLVRERYPTFEDALRDLDDAVSMLALFNALSADQKRDIPADAVNEARQLYEEFQLYVIRSQSLRKTFASIKGYYFQAVIHGQTVTWLAPHQFAQELPEEVDFRVMLSFLEFYRSVVKFVNFKLYADLGMQYPPKRLEKKANSAAEVAALEAEMKEAGKERDAAEAKGEGDEDADIAAEVAKDFGEQDEEAMALQQQVAQASRMKTTFRGLKVFISREVPLRPVYFALLCGGATAVGWEKGAKGVKSAPGSAFDMKFKHITHQLVDRPPDQFEQVEGREYVQPQWVFDSFNTGCLLPVAPYAPGRAPPPHLSPFVDDKAEGYVPRQREILDRFAAEATGAAAPGAGGEGGDAAATPAAQAKENAVEEYRKGLQAESKGVWHSEFKDEQKAKQDAEETKDQDMDEEEEEEPMKPTGFKGEELDEKVKPTEDEEELLRRKALMPKKHKRLLQRIETTKKKKADHNAGLEKKRKKAAEVK